MDEFSDNRTRDGDMVRIKGCAGWFKVLGISDESADLYPVDEFGCRIGDPEDDEHVDEVPAHNLDPD
jgi:hypothetical protein